MTIKDYLASPTVFDRSRLKGPTGSAHQRWDVVATIPEGVSESRCPTMLQPLLEDRFQLKMHRETKDLPVYVLGVSKSGATLTDRSPTRTRRPNRPTP